jgi:hypothetical protein
MESQVEWPGLFDFLGYDSAFFCCPNIVDIVVKVFG